MKIVRVASMAIALCIASASVAAAQGGSDSAQQGPPRRGPMGGRLLDGITLTDAQQAQLKVIREKYMPKMQEMRQAAMATGAPPDSAMRAQMMGLQASYNADMRAILTADQQKVFDKNVADEKERRAKMGPPRGN